MPEAEQSADRPPERGDGGGVGSVEREIVLIGLHVRPPPFLFRESAGAAPLPEDTNPGAPDPHGAAGAVPPAGPAPPGG
nr:hypothetical protein GCM10010200_104130 [Actinomadura rugatobispora]